jgi:Tol biopolymer transport system component
MTGTKQLSYLAAGLALVCGCFLLLAIFGPGVYRLLTTPSARPVDYEATLPVLIAQATALSEPPAPTGGVSEGPPLGRIVFNCQIFKFQASEQICIMNADGSGWRRLTQEDGIRHYYPSLAPDGSSVVYSQFREADVYEIYELSIADGTARRLTDRLGVLTGPEISPDGASIAFMRWTPSADQYQIWIMERDGSNPRRVFSGTGWDPTWSPDGQQILLASDMEGSTQLYTVDLDGTNLRRVSDLPAIRGRSDWSSQGFITTYSGESWRREVFIMNADGSGLRQVSPSGGNSQGPSFSPDGGWLAFTAYFDNFNDIHGCEIYIVRIDGTDLRRLTENQYCDYQPRWGP